MKREILFKGKRIDNGEWVEGDLLTAEPVLIFCNKNAYEYNVNTETVCQFTGLLDKNGNKIFEGDKANCKFGSFTVKFIDGCFFTCFVDNIAPLYAWHAESEIIGNIHD